jgi:hypothetical protein
LLPVRPNRLAKPAGNVPPPLKKLLIAPTTLRWLPLSPPVPGAPSWALMVRITSLPT